MDGLQLVLERWLRELGKDPKGKVKKGKRARGKGREAKSGGSRRTE
jgi:hypothetical protein